MDEVYASLAYDGALLLRVPVCVSRALLVTLASESRIGTVTESGINRLWQNFWL